MEKLIDATKELRYNINKYIDKLIKAKLDHVSAEDMLLTYFEMETLMVQTLQHLQCIIEKFEENDGN